MAAPLWAGKPPAPPADPADFTPLDGLGLRFENGSWFGEGLGWAMWIKPVTPEERLNFIERTTGFAIDPYAARAGQHPLFVTFLLVIENRGNTTLDFSPQSAWLRTNRKQVLLPQGLAELSFNYRSIGRELPVAYERMGKALYESAVSIPPGQQSAGLLVYESLHSKTKAWDISLRLTLPDGERVALQAPYRRTKKK